MNHEIHVNGIQVYAYHGCLAEEAKIGGHYTIDVKMLTDFSEAAQSDDLSNTIDYCDVAKIVQEEMAIRSKLIEQVGQRILMRMQAELPYLQGIELKVTKHDPPIPGEVDSVSIIFKA